MKSLGVILLLLCLCLLVFGIVVGTVGNHAVDAWAEQAARPASVADTIMTSRQTPPVNSETRSTGAWFGAGLLALVMVVIGAMLFTMQGGSELLRQWRLTRKRPLRRQPPIPFLSDTNLTEIPQARPVHTLPEVDDEQMVDSGH